MTDKNAIDVFRRKCEDCKKHDFFKEDACDRCAIKNAIEAMQARRLIILKPNVFLSREDSEKMRKEIIEQMGAGVVVVPGIMEVIQAFANDIEIKVETKHEKELKL